MVLACPSCALVQLGGMEGSGAIQLIAFIHSIYDYTAYIYIFLELSRGSLRWLFDMSIFAVVARLHAA